MVNKFTPNNYQILFFLRRELGRAGIRFDWEFMYDSFRAVFYCDDIDDYFDIYLNYDTNLSDLFESLKIELAGEPDYEVSLCIKRAVKAVSGIIENGDDLFNGENVMLSDVKQFEPFGNLNELEIDYFKSKEIDPILIDFLNNYIDVYLGGDDYEYTDNFGIHVDENGVPIIWIKNWVVKGDDALPPIENITKLVKEGDLDFVWRRLAIENGVAIDD